MKRLSFEHSAIPSTYRVDRFEEALQIIHKLVRTGEIDFHGKYYYAEGCELRPRGPRREGPPILIGARHTRMLRLAAQYADYWNGFTVGQQVEKVIAAREAVDAACIKVGRAPKTLQRTAYLLVDLPGGYTGPYADAHRRFRSAFGGGSFTLNKPDDLAELLRAFAREGVTLVHIWPEPNTLASIDALAPVLDLLDSQ